MSGNTQSKKRNYKGLKWTIGKKWIEMTKKLPKGHNIGGGNSQKRRQEKKLERKQEREQESN